MTEKEDIETLDRIRANVVKIREDKGLTVRELADQADLEPSVIQRFVKGYNDVKVLTLIKIARGLGVPLEELSKTK